MKANTTDGVIRLFNLYNCCELMFLLQQQINYYECIKKGNDIKYTTKKQTKQLSYEMILMWFSCAYWFLCICILFRSIMLSNTCWKSNYLYELPMQRGGLLSLKDTEINISAGRKHFPSRRQKACIKNECIFSGITVISLYWLWIWQKFQCNRDRFQQSKQVNEDSCFSFRGSFWYRKHNITYMHVI